GSNGFFTRDPMGRLIGVYTPGEGLKTYTWQTAKLPSEQSKTRVTGRLAAQSLTTTSTQPTGMVYSEVYGGYLFPRTLPAQTVGQKVIDGQGRLVAEVDNLGNVTRYTYAPSGQVATKTDQLGNTIAYAYDAVGRITAETDGRGKQTTYRYEENGRKVIKTDP